MDQQQKKNEQGIINRDLTRNELIEELGWSDETFKFRFAKFLLRYDFKEADFKEKGRYLFRKEWNEILYVLLNSIHEHPLYEEGSTEESSPLDKMVHYYRQLLAEIEDCLPREIRMDLMSHPIYLNTQIEFNMMEKLQRKLASWMSLITSMPPRVRIMMWNSMNESIDTWTKSICVAHVKDQEIKELVEKDTYLSHGEAEIQLEHLDVLLAHRLRKVIRAMKSNQQEQKIQAMEELDMAYVNMRRLNGDVDDTEIVNQLFEELVAPILNQEDKKREGVLQRLLKDTQDLVDRWRDMEHVLSEIPDEIKQLADLKQNGIPELLQSISYITEVYRQLPSSRKEDFESDMEGLFQKTVALTVAKSQKMLGSEP